MKSLDISILKDFEKAFGFKSIKAKDLLKQKIMNIDFDKIIKIFLASYIRNLLVKLT